MIRKFINMYMDQTAYGYWIVDFINELGTFESRRFNNDLDAHDFYMELMGEQYPTQTE